MNKNKSKIYNRKRLKIGGAIATTLTLTTTAVVLPTVYYGTADKLLYVDTFGQVQQPRETEIASPDHGNFIGPYDPSSTYSKDDVVSYDKVVWQDERMKKGFDKVTSTQLYKFTENWGGGDFNNAPVISYDPFKNNYTYRTLPFDQLFTTLDPSSFMGHSEFINGIGRSSASGKFDGAGGIYDSYQRPGFAYVESDPAKGNFNVHLSGLNQHNYTYTKTTPSKIRQFTQGSSIRQMHEEPNVVAQNSIPAFYESPENWYEIRNEYYNNGLVAYKFSNEGEVGQTWKSNINGDDWWIYKDMIDGYPYGPENLAFGSHQSIAAGEYKPTYVALSNSNSDKMTFSLDDDSLGMYLYSKASGYPLADRAACLTGGAPSLPVGFFAYKGYYQGTAEPLVCMETYNDSLLNEPKGGKYNEKYYHYLGQHQNVPETIKYHDGTGNTLSFNADSHQRVGAYIYSYSRQWPQDNKVMHYVNKDYYNNKDNPTEPKVEMEGSSYNWMTGKLADKNVARSFSYYNGVFSLNKPSTQLKTGENQQIRWYTPYASTAMRVTINKDKVEEITPKLLASDALTPSNIVDFVNFEMYDAIPSSYYGGTVSMCADNVTGTIWLKFRSGPGVNVSNGSLFKDPQQASHKYYPMKHPQIVAECNWAYDYENHGQKVGSAMWTDNNTLNPVTEIGMAEPLEYAVGITGFPKIKPTYIVPTNNPEGPEFKPGTTLAEEGKKYGPYRLSSPEFTKLTPYEYIKSEELKDPKERYKDLLANIFKDLVINKEPEGGILKEDGKPFISAEDLIINSDPIALNFYDSNHPDWGGRIQFSVTLKKYFDKNGEYIDGQGGFQPVPVVFSGFKAVPGPTQVTGNYNLNSLIPGGAVNFNKQNLPGSNGVSYPSDYIAESLAPEGSTIYAWLADMVNRWSNENPFKGTDDPNIEANNKAFTKDSYMIKNLPHEIDATTGKEKAAFTLNDKSVEINNFTGLLRITPSFNSFYNTEGNLVTGVTQSLGTITISGFQTVNGSTYIPNVVNAITTNLQPSAIVTRINGEEQTKPITSDNWAEYIGQELYKVAWNEAINLPTKNYDLPPYTEAKITSEQMDEIKRVIQIRVKPEDGSWVNNVEGSLKFAVAFTKMFDKDGIPKDIDPAKIWPANWDVGGDDNDNVFLVTAFGYDNSPGPTGILQKDGKNRNITINQPNYQPSEFIKNDAQSGYPLIKSLIIGNLTNLPKSFTTDDIVVDPKAFNEADGGTWEPDVPPLKAINQKGSIQVKVYLKSYYNDQSKLCNYKEDNAGKGPYSKDGWTFTIDGFMQTTAKGSSDLTVTDAEYPKGADKNVIDLANPNVYDFMKRSYPEIAALKNLLPYQSASTTDIKNLIFTLNKSSSKTKDPYLLMTNIPSNIRPYNIIVDKENIKVDNIAGTLTFQVNLRQWFTLDSGQVTYHPTLDDQSNGNDMYTTPHSITIKGMRSVKNATVIKPGDLIDPRTGTLTLAHGGPSESIIKGILKGQYLDANPDATPEDIDAEFKDFDVTKIQPSSLNDIALKEYVYVALEKSGGSPYTLLPGSMVYQDPTSSDDDPIYRIKNEAALNEFISWKITPFIDLTKGTAILSPMLNIWFGGASADIYNQYQSFGGGENGKPTVTKDADGTTIIAPATVTQLTLSGFIAAENALQFNSSPVYECYLQWYGYYKNYSITIC